MSIVSHRLIILNEEHIKNVLTDYAATLSDKIYLNIVYEEYQAKFGVTVIVHKDINPEKIARDVFNTLHKVLLLISGVPPDMLGFEKDSTE